MSAPEHELATKLNDAESKSAHWHRQLQIQGVLFGFGPDVDEHVDHLQAKIRKAKEDSDTLGKIRDAIKQRSGQVMANSWERDLLREIEGLLKLKLLK
jgi:hypothetical protein